MPDREAALRLLSAAQRDLQAIGNMLDPDLFALEVFGFHAQQAVEKAAKSWLVSRDVSFPFTHNVRHLLYLMSENGSAFGQPQELIELTAFAVQTRYDSYFMGDEIFQREDILDRVREFPIAVEASINAG